MTNHEGRGRTAQLKLRPFIFDSRSCHLPSLLCLDRKASPSDGALTWLRDSFRHRGFAGSLRYYAREFVDLLRDLTPERRKSRYGDVDYDFEHGVDTAWATISLRTRLREWLSGGQYQPSEPALFDEMLSALPAAADGFTFIDLGSGKGRTLLMASSYPFRRIIGVELLEELNAIALENIARYRSPEQQCFNIEAKTGDASRFEFPAEPAVLYLVQSFSPARMAGSPGKPAPLFAGRAPEGVRHLPQSGTRGHSGRAGLAAGAGAHPPVRDL